MKINGVEISKVDSTILTKQLGAWRAVRIVWFILCIALCATLVYVDAPALYVIPIGLIVTVLFMLLFSRPIRQLNRELSSRQQSEEETLSNKKAEKESTKKLLKFIIVLSILAIVFGLFIGKGMISGYDNEEKCKNCGRTTDLVPGFGYCDDCYDGFVDWQEDNWKKD